METTEILRQMGIDEGAEVSQFKRAEDGSGYAAWRVAAGGRDYVLKKAKGCELSVYQTFFKKVTCGAPRFYQSLKADDGDYFLMEYVTGGDLRNCDRKSLTAAVDALIGLQDMYWEKRELQAAGYGFEASLPGRQNRGKYLNDPELKEAYNVYLQLYSTLPRTLCHDDLLPFNVLIAGERATLIDWEYAGILPYPTSIARLIAHGTEDEDAFFYMKKADQEFAVEYYYARLVKGKGIRYDDYRRALDYFLLYEYCEWIMLGIRHHNTGSDRFKEYFAKAKELVKRLS